MNKGARVIVGSLVMAVMVLVAACSTATEGTPLPAEVPIPALPESAPETTTTTQPRPLTNERGFVPKKLGENSCYGSVETDPCANGVTFAIDKIVVDPPCDEFGERSRHTLVLSLRVATGTDSSSIQDASLVFNPFSFIVIDKNGVSQKAEFGICTSVTNNPDTYGPNQKYAFKLELDVPVAHGTLALQPGIMGDDGAGGWEWPF